MIVTLLNLIGLAAAHILAKLHGIDDDKKNKDNKKKMSFEHTATVVV